MQGPILIVEDDAQTAATIAASLRQHGFAVETVDDGLAALGRLRMDPTPAAILLDLLIPSVDGYSVFNELRDNRRFHDVPIVVMSGATIVDLALLEGAHAVLAKPRGERAWGTFLEDIHAALKNAIAAGPRNSAPPAE